MTTLHSIAPQGAGARKSEHYPSLELCKKLTEVGFPETELYYVDAIPSYGITDIEIRGYDSHSNFNYSCPSITELFDELPPQIQRNGSTWQWSLTPYTFGYTNFDNEDDVLFYIIDTNLGYSLSDSLAEMWLWLKENNYLP